MRNNEIAMVGVPMDLGADRRGVDMGPSAIRYASVKEKLAGLGYRVKDLGNLVVPTPESMDAGENKLKYMREITAVSRELAETTDQVVQSGCFPLILGGDHSIAIGSIAGVARHHKRMGVIWFDAHGDLNTSKTSPSGNIHGMPLAISLGWGHPDLVNIGGVSPKLRPEDVVIIGARQLDEGERTLIREQGIHVFTMHDIDRMGMGPVMEEALQIVTDGTDGVHLSLDLDSLDPVDAPGVGTPVAGGITYRESHLAMEILAETGVLTSAEFVEVNPILDHGNRTAKAAVALIGSVFGEKVL
ncbi:MAG: arginase [Firmicutes bacterium]|mgnify:CR=1 FL=1|uniref:Arginase n=1 Tax=Melghirimyces thermohalophilus TaxID=1236220 RepID=A0A1G6NDE8_9BACL|nr:arginase [Melghirimyces thermohalophilus]MDA8354681.1 arginase [Bacillota bacterium]SDC65474.1 arginase [Melghirimyces thermohalophilus]